MAVSLVQVPVLELRRRGQHDVGVAGGVGQEDLVHHGEEIFPRQAAEHPVRVRRHRRRVAVENIEGADRRVQLRERRAQAIHVHHARAGIGAVAAQFGWADHIRRPGPVAAGAVEEAAALLSVVADEGGQARQRADGGAAVAVALQAHRAADERRPQRAVIRRQLRDLRHRQAGDRGRPLRRPLRHAPAQRIQPHGMLSRPRLVHPPPGEQQVHQRQHHGAVRSRLRHQVAVGALGGQGTVRVDQPHLRAAAPGFVQPRNEVRMGARRVRAPQENQSAVDHVLRVRAEAAAHSHPSRFRPRDGADGAIQPARAHAGPEPGIADGALHGAQRAGVAVGKDRFGAVRFQDRLPAAGDRLQRLLPRDALEAALSLGADASERMAQPLRMEDQLQIAVDFRAEPAAGVGVVRIPLDPNGPTGFVQGDHPAAGVRAVVRAGAFDAGDAAHGWAPLPAPAAVAGRRRHLEFIPDRTHPAILRLCTRVGALAPGGRPPPAGSCRTIPQ